MPVLISHRLVTIAREVVPEQKEIREGDPSDGDFGLDALDFRMHRGVRTPVTTFPGTGAERFLDDGLDGPGTSPAFSAASETSVNLLRRTPQVVCCGHGGADVVIGQHVTGTNDHETEPNCDTRTRAGYCWTVSRNAKGNLAVSSYSKLPVSRIPAPI